MPRLLSGEQRRRLIDTQQSYEVLRLSQHEATHRFAGSLRWAMRGERRYLLRKIRTSETSLGPESAETRAIFAAFEEGRRANAERVRALKQKMEGEAALNRAMGLARMPRIAARVLRRCDEAGLLGENLFVIGTHALYAYEAEAGVLFENDLLATGDLDILFDARARIALAARERISSGGLIGLLRKADASFELLTRGGFRAANKEGFLVELIAPQPRRLAKTPRRSKLDSEAPDDLEGAEIFGLDWLINAPKRRIAAIDERGLPAPIATIDPRIFALHKAWMSGRSDRSRLKATRDLAQAKAVAVVAERDLGLSFDAPELSALPKAFLETWKGAGPADQALTDDW